MKASQISEDQVIATAHEAAVARYWNEKQSDAINLLLGQGDGLIHHLYGVGEFDRSILQLPAESREEPLLAELHRMENRQTEIIINSLGGVGRDGRILDAGSGRGGTAFMLHNRFGCLVDGITISTYQVEFSRRLAEERGCADKVKFHFQNMLRTGFPDDSFDRARAEQVLQHIASPETAVAELTRVTRAGGLIAVMEPDWDTLVIDADDLMLSRAFSSYHSGRLLPHGAIGRRLPALFREAGLIDVSVTATVLMPPYRPLKEWIESTTNGVVAEGGMSESQARVWLDDLERRGREERFFGAFSYFRVVGRVP